jgi:hypothetical protein
MYNDILIDWLIIFISSIFEELQFINKSNKTVLKIKQKNKDIQLEHGVLHLHTSDFRYSVAQYNT